MREHDSTGENGDELETGPVVESPQAGGEAGEQATSENGGRGLEDPHNGDEGDDLEGRDDDEQPSSDGTDDEQAPAVARARKQAARYRRELRETEDELDRIRGELWTARVESLGLLADPDDLEFDPDALEDPDRLRELAEDLLARKPHLRSRRIRSRAGQGEGSNGGEFSLAGLLRRGA